MVNEGSNQGVAKEQISLYYNPFKQRRTLAERQLTDEEVN